MMSYRYDKGQKSKKRWYLAGIFAIMLVIFTPVYHWIFNIFEGPLARSWEQKDLTFDGTENFIEAFYGKKQILKENKELQNEIDRLEIDNLRTEYLANQLENIIGITNETDNEIANVLKHGTLGSRDTLIINKGSKQSISIGDKITAVENVLIGEVTEIYDHSALVTLYSHVGETIEGILFPHNQTVQAKGYGGGSFMIESPREIEVIAGDILYSQQEPGTIIAIVQEVVFDPRDPFKQVYLSYPVNINQIQLVSIKKQTPSTINIE